MHDANTTDADVIIVGAGVSGMAAAHALSDKGLSVLVLEADARVGGRTWSDRTVSGGPVDYGGMYLGQTHSQLRNLGLSLGLETVSAVKQGTDLYLVGGEPIAAPDGVLPTNLTFTETLNQTYSQLNELSHQVGSAPWSSPLSEQLDRQTVADWIDTVATDPVVRMFHTFSVNCVLGADPSEVSMLYWAYYVHACEGIQTLMSTRGGAQYEWWVGGADQVSSRIADRLAGSVRLNCPVTAVSQDENGVKVRVYGGEVITGRRAIVAMSPANAHRIHFSPQLTPARQQLQMRAPMGRLSKVLIRYDTPFWEDACYSGNVSDIDGLGMDMFPGTKPTDSAATLIGFISGSNHDRYHTLTKEDRREAVLTVLATCFGERARRPTYFHLVDWTAQPWAQGGPATYMPPGVMGRHGHAAREPIGRIHFAGTEASPMWAGYMEGGVRAGQHAAAEVLAASGTRAAKAPQSKSVSTVG